MTDLKDVPGNYTDTNPDTKDFTFNHTMIRVKDPKVSLDFYTRIMGMKLVRKNDFPNANSLYIF